MARNDKDKYGFEPFKDTDLGIDYVRPTRPDRYNPHAASYTSLPASGSDMTATGPNGSYNINDYRQGVNFRPTLSYSRPLPNMEVQIDYFPSEDVGVGFDPWDDSLLAPLPIDILDLPSNTRIRMRDKGIGLSFNAVIEPQSIRNMISQKSLDMFVEKLPRAHLMDGNLDAFDGTDRVSQTKPKNRYENSVKAYFFDAQSNVGRIALQGFLCENQTKIRPFNDSEAYNALGDLNDTEIKNVLIESSLTVSGTHILNGYPYVNEELFAVGGFEYQGAYDTGIDSISYGDRNDFFIRGYQDLRDSLISTYPKNARIDNNRPGTTSVVFDDVNTIVFNKNVTIEYGRNIQALTILSSSLSGSEVSDPDHIVYPLVGQQRFVVRNLDGALVGQGSVVKGLSDNQYIPGADSYLLRGHGTMEPFIESSLYIDNESSFYRTGTSNSILPGFSTRLSSKSILQFDITPHKSASVFFSTGTSVVTDGSSYTDSSAGAVAGINSGLAYYNWTGRQWETIGNLITGSNVDYINDSIAKLTASYLATIPGQHVISSISGPDIENSFGIPMNSCGFPLDAKFNASSSQLLSMESKLTTPFLLEKVVLEMSATIPGPAFNEWGGGVYHSTDVSPTTFMLLRQSNAGVKGVTKTTSFWTGEFGPSDNVASGPRTGSKAYPTYTVDNPMDVIWFGRIGTFDINNFATVSDFSSSYPGYYESADLWVPSTGATHYVGKYFTGTIRLEVPVRNVNIGEAQSSLLNSRAPSFQMHMTGAHEMILGNSIGGCNLFDLSCGRRIIRSVSGGKVIGHRTYPPVAIPDLPKYDSVQSIAPYFLLPTDKLILCAAKQLVPGDRTEENVAQQDNLQIYPTAAKLTLYGSMVVNDQESHDTLNQELTSNAIHEAVQDSPITDQILGENTMNFYGGYLDNILTGTFMDGDRGVAGSVVAGQAGITASLSRMIRFNTDERFYDSIPPSIQDIFKIAGKKLLNSGQDFLMLGEPGAATHNSDTAFSSWAMAYPFEPKYATARRLQNFNYFDNLFEAEDKDGASTASSEIEYFGFTGSLNTVRQLLGYNFGDVEKILINSSPTTTSLKTIQTEQLSPLKFFFGIGDGPYNLPTLTDATPSIGAGRYFDYVVATPLVRGYKYGLLNVKPQFTSQVYRYDSYGQPRDMLEQRVYSRIVRPDGTMLSAIDINFVNAVGDPVDPYETSGLAMTAGSNLSKYATSSLPYFDGEYRNGIPSGSV